MTSGSDQELAQAIGERIVKDADHLRRFMPDYFARFAFERCGEDFEVHIYRVTPEPFQE